MAYVLGHNQYGKAETRVVRVYRDTDPHEIVDYNVSCALSGDMDDVHFSGDNAKCLTTDAVKNTVNAFCKEYGEEARQPETLGIALATHFVDDNPQISRAKINLDMYPWARLESGGAPSPHAFVKDNSFIRTCTVIKDGDSLSVVGGVKDMTVLKTTDSEFWGFYEEKYTTLKPTKDRVMATSVKAQWAYAETNGLDWGKTYDVVRTTIAETFAGAYSYALQHTLWEMGQAVLDAAPAVAEIRFSCPNKHHFVIDLSPFGLENPNEVFHADDRPYGLIEATIARDAAVSMSHAYDPGQGW